MSKVTICDLGHVLPKTITIVRFSAETLHKLRAIAKTKQKPINRLVNDYVKAFVDEEFMILQKLARKPS